MREIGGRFPRRRWLRSAGILVVLGLAIGCNKRYTPVPVSGVVLLDGAPLEGANVNFYPVGDEKDGGTAMGVTNEKGEFQLSSFGKNDGALPRKYKVVISKFVPSQPNLKMPDFPNTLEGRNAKQDFMYENFEKKGIQPFISALPAIYSDSNTTPLECDVKGKMSGVKFELSSK